jgi:hypothetical protein
MDDKISTVINADGTAIECEIKDAMTWDTALAPALLSEHLKLRQRVIELEQIIEQLWYPPNRPGYLEALESFESGFSRLCASEK